MADVEKFPKNGVFKIGTMAIGAPFLKVFLSIDLDTNVAVGTATFSQPVNPPKHIQNPVHGPVYATGLGKAEQLYALTGTVPVPGMVGQTYVCQVAIALEGIWGKTGTAHYMIYNDTPKPVIYDKQPVTVDWLLLD